MRYDFNTIIERRNTNSLKYDFALERGFPDDVLPLWVADMDFKTPPQVIESIEKAVQHGIFGYSDVKGDYFNSIKNWFLSGFGFDLQADWLVKTPGVVFAIAMAIRGLTEEGEAVLIQKPVYYPFADIIVANNRKLINNPLVYHDGKYQIDFEDFERKIVENNVKLFILCSPHNPVGRVWTKEELLKIGDICLKHNCLVVSDEIHCDFVYEGYRHHIFMSLQPAFADITIFCTAPSKTFNLAGLQVSNIFIPNAKIRHKFKQEMRRTGYGQLNTVGLVACQSAYEYGKPWLDELKAYLTSNLNYLREFLTKKIPQVRLVEPQGTYLVWLDFTKLHISNKQLEDLLVHKAKLWLDLGTMFGENGEGFARINIACPLETLKRALEQLHTSIA